MPERFRGELLTMGRYTNPASFPPFLFNVAWTKDYVCVCDRLLLIAESIYQSVTDSSTTVLSWLADKYSSWKLGRERSNSTSADTELSENISLPSTGLLFE